MRFKKWYILLVIALIAACAFAPCASAMNLNGLDSLMQKKKSDMPEGGKAARISSVTGGITDVVIGVSGSSRAVSAYETEVVRAVFAKANYPSVTFADIAEDQALSALDNGDVTLLMGYAMDDSLFAHVEEKSGMDESALMDETVPAEESAEEIIVTTGNARYIASAPYVSGKSAATTLYGETLDFGGREYYLIGLSSAAKVISDFDIALERADIDGDLDRLWRERFETGSFFTLFSAIRRAAKSVWRQFRINLIEESRYKMIFTGLQRTLVIAFCAAALGVLLGCLIALMRLSKLKFLNAVSSVYVDIIRGTPVVVQLMIMYYVILTSPNISKVTVAIITFGLNSGAYVSEMVRGGILAVDKGQTEAGRSLGLSASATMLLIVLPQTIKIIIPSLFNEIVALLKETSVVGFIGLMDLTKAGDFIRSRTYSAFFPLLAVAAVYLVLVTVLTRVFNMIERRMRQGDLR